MQKFQPVDPHDVDRSYKVDNLGFAPVNARSIKAKEHLISETMKEFKINTLVVTETWLEDNKEDDQWTKSYELNTNRYQNKPSTELITGVEELV